MIASPARKKRTTALARSIVAIEKQYGSMLKNTGSPAASIDPWQMLRGADDFPTQHGRPARMNRPPIARIISVLAGAAVLFGLEQGLGVTLYFAVPLAIVVYFAVKLAFGLLWSAGDKAT
jgi:hypothetical protein